MPTSISTPFAGVDGALSGERQMLAVFRGQHQGEQVRTRTATGDRVRGGRRLADRLAAAAGDLLPHVQDRLPAARHTFEGLGDVLAQLADGAAALGAGAGRRVEDPLARQVLRQGPAGRFADATRSRHLVGGRRRDLGHGLCFGGGRLELAQLQLELGDDLRPTLGRLAELLAPGQRLCPIRPRSGAGPRTREGRAAASGARSPAGHQTSGPRPRAVRRAPPGSSRAPRRGHQARRRSYSRHRFKQSNWSCQHPGE